MTDMEPILLLDPIEGEMPTVDGGECHLFETVHSATPLCGGWGAGMALTDHNCFPGSAVCPVCDLPRCQTCRSVVLDARSVVHT